MLFAFFSFGGGEIFIVFLAVLVLFGANKIPELARTLGKGMNEFKKATDDLKKEFREGTQDFTDDLKEGRKEIENHVKDINSTITESDSYEPYENNDNSDDEESKVDEKGVDSNSQPRINKASKNNSISNEE